MKKIFSPSELKIRRKCIARLYRSKNKDRQRIWHREWVEKNRDRCRKMNLKRILKDPVRFKKVQDRYKHSEKGQETIKKYRKQWRDKQIENSNYRIRIIISSRIKEVLERGLAKKNDFTWDLLGCSPTQLVEYIERFFLPGMSWKNRSKWHIDHIIPLSCFSDLTNPKQQKQCFHFSNLQPLWKEDNLKKNKKYMSADQYRDLLIRSSIRGFEKGFCSYKEVEPIGGKRMFKIT